MCETKALEIKRAALEYAQKFLYDYEPHDSETGEKLQITSKLLLEVATEFEIYLKNATKTSEGYIQNATLADHIDRHQKTKPDSSSHSPVKWAKNKGYTIGTPDYWKSNISIRDKIYIMRDDEEWEI